MIRILLVETLLFGLLGAIAFRLSFAFIRRMAIAWAVSVLLIVMITISIGARIDPALLHEFGASPRSVLPAIVLRAVRAAAWLLGSLLAWLAVRKRKALGMEPPPDLPPGDI
jgi:hypothetical protein